MRALANIGCVSVNFKFIAAGFRWSYCGHGRQTCGQHLEEFCQCARGMLACCACMSEAGFCKFTGHWDALLKILSEATTAPQVIFTVLGSIPIFGQYPSYWFLLGALLVSLSVALYGTTPEQSTRYCAAIGVFFKEPVWLHTFRTSPSMELRKARCEFQVGVSHRVDPVQSRSTLTLAGVGIN